MKHKFLYTVIAGLLLASMALSACGTKATSTATSVPVAAVDTPKVVPTVAVVPTAAPTKAPEKTTIIIGTTDTVASLDPGDAYAVHDWELIKNISEGLLKWNPGTTDLVPALATDLGAVSADGLTYTFTLKDGIKLGNGQPWMPRCMQLSSTGY